MKKPRREMLTSVLSCDSRLLLSSPFFVSRRTFWRFSRFAPGCGPWYIWSAFDSFRESG